MKSIKIITVFILSCFLYSTEVLSQFKPEPVRKGTVSKAKDLSKYPFENAKDKLQETKEDRQLPSYFQMKSWPAELMDQDYLQATQLDNNKLPIWMEGKISATENRNVQELNTVITQLVEKTMHNTGLTIPNSKYFELKNFSTDDLGIVHSKMQQQLHNIQVYGGEYISHLYPDGKLIVNGRLLPFENTNFTTPTLTVEESKTIVSQDLYANNIKIKALSLVEKNILKNDQVRVDTVWYFDNSSNKLVLTYHISIYPSISDHWDYFIDVQNGRIIEKINNKCQKDVCVTSGCVENREKAKAQHQKQIEETLNFSEIIIESTSPDGNRSDGSYSATGLDLLNVNRAFNTYKYNGTFYMIDAAQSMFVQGSIPSDPAGVIRTWNSNNTNPFNNNFNPGDYTSSNNNWNQRNAVSGHYNALKAYTYFKQVHGRNSIDGNGGNVNSFVNVPEEDGKKMDNAFWSGSAIFYGAGDFAFSDLAAGLDVAGHEMSHGVIQNTAGLIYKDESGALNEAFADIFGVMIERENWKIGERVVNTNYFRSGAMRDMSNPHNGGSSLNDPGFQPRHMNEKYNGSEDNGGVHINSGIINFAYYKIATALGNEKAEKIFYRALNKYLVKSSTFIDCRNAAIQAAKDIYSLGSEVSAIENAFTEVGIGAGSGGGHETDLIMNPGTPFLMYHDPNLSRISIADINGGVVANPLFNQSVFSKPSVTDDGQFAVFVGGDKKLYLMSFNYQTGDVNLEILQNESIWRNVSISKRGNLLAAITDDVDDYIYIYSFERSEWKAFQLYNQTTAQNSSPVYNVIGADAMEWTYSGDVLMYDALNQLTANETGWDISFLYVWNPNTNNFGDGSIVKMLQNVPSGVSVGNPTFAKNSPYIIAFDYLDETGSVGDYRIYGLNLERGDLGIIYSNIVIGYPSYANDDKSIVFDAMSQANTSVLGRIELSANKISTSNTGTIFINNSKWGTWFANGFRTLTSNTEGLSNSNEEWKIFPNPVLNEMVLELPESWRGNEVAIRIYNTVGQVVYEEKIDYLGYRITIESTSKLGSGTYLIRCEQKDEFVIKYFIKTK